MEPHGSSVVGRILCDNKLSYESTFSACVITITNVITSLIEDLVSEEHKSTIFLLYWKISVTLVQMHKSFTVQSFGFLNTLGLL